MSDRLQCVEISEETLWDLINIETGVLHPLNGFMNEADFRSVVDGNVLGNNQIFTIPITMDVPADLEVSHGSVVRLYYQGRYVAEIEAEDIYETQIDDWGRVFGTKDLAHPGVKKELDRSSRRIGGRTKLTDRKLLDNALKPSETKAAFREKKWNTIVGFQTRNPIHKAHEYIQRLGMEMCDGLFINPITGWKKEGDFTEEAVIAAYKIMIDEFYPRERVYFAGLKTQMRYAGPREAIFHALIRRNLGCTHFIIGRDHAGVGEYYGSYDAHKLAEEITSKFDIGIELILTREPYYCQRCDSIVTDRTCAHYHTDRIPISGTKIRKYIVDRKMPDEIMMRKEILSAILGCEHIFVKGIENDSGNTF